jgi:hypothetical protein
MELCWSACIIVSIRYGFLVRLQLRQGHIELQYPAKLAPTVPKIGVYSLDNKRMVSLVGKNYSKETHHGKEITQGPDQGRESRSRK